MNNINMRNLVLRYLALWNHIGCLKHDPLRSFSHLCTKYSEAHRLYHNLRHIERCFKELDTVPLEYFQKLDIDLSLRESDPPIKSKDLVEMVLWWHDEEYTPGAEHNEIISALDMRRFLQKAEINPDFITLVGAGIMSTKHDGNIIPLDTPHWIHYVLDINLLSFRQPYEVFIQDSRDIREEYRITVPSDYDFAVGRQAILNMFYNRKPLYLTDHFRNIGEDVAKANLRRAMEEARKKYNLPT